MRFRRPCLRQRYGPGRDPPSVTSYMHAFVRATVHLPPCSSLEWTCSLNRRLNRRPPASLYTRTFLSSSKRLLLRSATQSLLHCQSRRQFTSFYLSLAKVSCVGVTIDWCVYRCWFILSIEDSVQKFKSLSEAFTERLANYDKCYQELLENFRQLRYFFTDELDASSTLLSNDGIFARPPLNFPKTSFLWFLEVVNPLIQLREDGAAFFLDGGQQRHLIGREVYSNNPLHQNYSDKFNLDTWTATCEHMNRDIGGFTFSLDRQPRGPAFEVYEVLKEIRARISGTHYFDGNP
jgi:hypothetical protein